MIIWFLVLRLGRKGVWVPVIVGVLQRKINSRMYTQTQTYRHTDRHTCTHTHFKI